MDCGSRSVLLMLVASSACSSAPQQEVKLVPEGTLIKEGGSAPDWVMRTPQKKGSICAVGAVDPTFFRQDGLTHAAESARNELARTVQVKINAVMYDYQDNTGSRTDQSFVQEVVGSISDVVLSGAQVLEYWYDERGSVSRRGMTYALACMDTDQSVAQLAERLQQAAPSEDREEKIAEVRERAQAAFDELEAMEEKKESAAAGGTEADKPVPPEASP
ncbi:MAG: LPP20 family lipoprotein [Deltaproteobacteria bacterium]|nr:LPP20 family lipoprotein [Deltaproteobacteria bacterium]